MLVFIFLVPLSAEREDSFRALIVVVNGKRDALVEKGDIRHLPAHLQVIGAEGAETFDEFSVMGPNGPVLGENLVEKPVQFVIIETRLHAWLVAFPLR